VTDHLTLVLFRGGSQTVNQFLQIESDYLLFASFRSKIFSSITSGKKKNIAPHYKNYFLIPCDIFIDDLHSFLIPALILSTNIHKISIAFMIEEWNAYSEKGS
jgi:hypothetical protein